MELSFRWFRWHQLRQIAAPGIPYTFMRPHPIYHHRNITNATVQDHRPDYDATYTLNSLGMRGSVDYGAKPASTTRLLMIGDSFTFGFGVNDDEPFPSLIQRAFTEEGLPIEVINAGHGSYSPILHYLALRNIYLGLEPDAVILWLDFADIQDDYQYERHLLYDRQGRLVACNMGYVNGWPDVVGGLLFRSALLKYFESKFIRSYQKIRVLGWWNYFLAKLRGEDTKKKAIEMIGRRRARVDLVKYDRFLMTRGFSTTAEIERYWGRTGAYILKIRDLLREHGIPLVLGIYPYGHQVGVHQWHDGRVYEMLEQGVVYDDPRPFAFIEAFGARHGIPVINTSPSFIQARDETLYLPLDGHFNAAGHRVIASHLLHDPVFLSLVENLQQRAVISQASVGRVPESH